MGSYGTAMTLGRAASFLRDRSYAKRTWVSLTVVLVLLSATGCCGKVVYPGFAGVPELIDRSNDFTLPLSDDDRDRLTMYLASGGDRTAVEDDEVDPEKVPIAADNFRSVLESLTRPVTPDDLKDGTDMVQLFDERFGILTVHDARVGRDENRGYFDLTPGDIRGLVRGDFVFAFYLRRLDAVKVGVSDDGKTIWIVSSPATPPAYTGVVVFRKAFAIPTAAR